MWHRLCQVCVSLQSGGGGSPSSMAGAQRNVDEIETGASHHYK